MKSTDYLKSNKHILLEIIKKIAELENPNDQNVARMIAKNTSTDSETFSKSQIIKAYHVYKNEINFSPKEEKKFLNSVKMKRIRTVSGVTPVAILTKPFPCPGNCIYCPNDPQMPKSYLSMEPGAQRALQNVFDPYLQVYNRLVAYKNIGHSVDKIELIVLGGTWSFYPKNYQVWFIKRVFDAMNDFNIEESLVEYLEISKQKDEEETSWEELFDAQKQNETSGARCVGLVLETRPDYISEGEVRDLRKLGATKIQIGMQSLDDNILKLNKRGHGVGETKKAFELLRLAGFKIHAHWMPNLYGSNPEKDIEDFKEIFTNENLKPDELKIYPCSLIADTKLFEIYEKGGWEPYSDEELLHVLEECIAFTPRYCRLTRVVRDISSDDIVVGNKKSNFRQIVQKSLEDKGIKIEDIRYREIRNEKVDENDLELRTNSYETNCSTEYFLEYVTKEDKIAGFLRLSIPKKDSYIEEIKDTVVIREVHVYGSVVGIGEEEEDRAQHIGLGTKLIKKAEEIAREKEYRKISVISSIGTREYYKKKGYMLKVLYQIKDIS
ncbi:tRNA uridine(34) 5-carboxymethylaminomethyl modification radical SAM/GNAT enzyme Elp3 [Patescibacteria group bacterium]|nr:tRNA uridine(34) 5-carboxymethylaminomethyl modification radical SAM/GNAT enzyme Elp3 [Patescibacteria group bacterium]